LAIGRSRGAFAQTPAFAFAQLSTAAALRLRSFQTAILDRDAPRACFLQAKRKPATPSQPLFDV
jgi:hypothetical protein